MGRRLFIISILLLIATETFAFDGKRKGFVLGGGIGFAPITTLTCSSFNLKNTSIGFGYELLAGKGVTDRDLVALEIRAVVREAQGVSSLFLQHEFFGLSWQRYWSAAPRSFFSNVGFGRVLISSFDMRKTHPDDPAF